MKPQGLSPAADRYISGESSQGQVGAGQVYRSAAAAAATEWVALRSGTVYYRATCQAAPELPASEIVRFRTELDPQATGRSASRVVGCS